MGKKREIPKLTDSFKVVWVDDKGKEYGGIDFPEAYFKLREYCLNLEVKLRVLESKGAKA